MSTRVVVMVVVVFIVFALEARLDRMEQHLRCPKGFIYTADPCEGAAP